MPRHESTLSALAALVVLTLGPASGAAPASAAAAKEDARPITLDPKLFKELSFRSIGPANMGGRVSSFAVNEKRPATFYMGLGTGGVFKTTNAGTTWTPVFEKEAVASIGALALWPKNPNVVWAGTGEANNRNSSSWGNGVYRSTDGGGKWEHLGLDATRNVSRILIDPSDSNTVYVAALGRLWGENPERGVYKTTDGGKSWNLVLKADSRTGACDLVMDPANPGTLIAALYTRIRKPWSYAGGSTTGGLFRTTDGGRSWTKLTAGLPAQTGRIGLDIYRKNPKVVYAVIESDEGGHLAEFESRSRAGGVFRSDDGGDHWTRLSAYAPRPFYFSQIRVQPDDDKRVYLCGFDLWISDDGGATFRPGGAKNCHPDLHALWINPANGDELILGTDGGLFASHDRAQNWDFINNLAVGEFYNLAVDMRDPYFVYGGLQDNQSWGGPSRLRYAAESFMDDAGTAQVILNDNWFDLGGGDGFHVAADPTNYNIVYFESQGGELNRLELDSGRIRSLKPSNKEGEPRFRFNWNTPFMISPHDPTILWMGGDRLFKLYDRGNRWQAASPDLTTRNPDRMATGGSAAETYCTIVTLTESPLKAGLIWVGTDDGKVWITPDAGATWTDLTGNLRGVPPGLYMSRIEAGHKDAGTAYLAIDGHRTDDINPYLLVTRDYGRSWKSIVNDLPKDNPIKVIREDLANPDLLFAGTEFGLYASFNGGGHWVKFMSGLPTVAVDDILIHPRDRDLLAGTHGRSIYILDDITPFEQWSDSVLVKPVVFFPPRPATAYQTRSLSGIGGQRIFRASNPPFGAYLNYFVKAEIEGGVSIAVADSSGGIVRTLSGPGSPGLHRVVWDLQGDPKKKIGRPEWNNQPEFVPAGRYSVTLTAGENPPVKRTLEVKHAPGTELSPD